MRNSTACAANYNYLRVYEGGAAAAGNAAVQNKVRPSGARAFRVYTNRSTLAYSDEEQEERSEKSLMGKIAGFAVKGVFTAVWASMLFAGGTVALAAVAVGIIVLLVTSL